jgi:NAD(P)-dependent dehydrogenase (short-subunit alcohol dehydrogenase family)
MASNQSANPTSRTVVVTGGSAGVGRAAALIFAKRGWNVAIIARAGLEGAAQEIRGAGAEVKTIAADVADAEAVFAAAEEIENWRPVDVWINSAMATLFAPLSDISPEEFRRVTDVTYLGYVFGTMAALKHMRRRNAGTIVQVGSALSYRAIPLQSAYCGAKFAIRGFTDAIRSELKHDHSQIRLTMVQLPAVNTPQFDWARNKMPCRPQPVPPIYQPEAVAESVFRAAQNAPRELWVGLPSIRAILGNMVAPGLLDRYLASEGYSGQLSAEANPKTFDGNLFAPAADGHRKEGRFAHEAKRAVASVSAGGVRSILGALSISALILLLGILLLLR